MEQRKIVAFGNSSYIISLPKRWIERNRLHKGDVLNLDEKDNEILLSLQDSAERRQFKETTIEIGSKPLPQLKTEVISAYINNLDIITVQGIRSEYSVKIKEMLQGLAGMEVVEETATRIVVKDLLDIKEVSVENLVRRVDTIIRSMLEDLNEWNPEHYSSLVERDKEINRMVLLGYRVVRAAFDNPRVAKMFNAPYFDLLILRQILINLERFADEIKRISRNSVKAKKLGDIKKLGEAITREYYEVMKVFYSKNTEEAFRKETEIKGLFKLCDTVMEKNNTVEFAGLVEHFKYMIGAITAIVRSTLERT